jgi:hypothetical protein
MSAPLLSASQMMSIRTIAESGFQTDVTIKRPVYGPDDLGDDAIVEIRTIGTVKGWIRQDGGDNIGGIDAGSIVTTGQFELAFAVGTDIRPRDFVEIAVTPVDEAQTIVIVADGGIFQLTFGGDETTDLPFDVTAGALQTALLALPSIGAGNAAVAAFGDGFMVTFGGDLAGQGLDLLVLSDNDLTHTDPDIDPDVEIDEHTRGTSTGRYNVAEVKDDETWPAMLNCTVRRRA